MGTTHVPGNSATLQAIAAAFPGEKVAVFAEPSHLSELRRDPVLTGTAGISFHSIELSAYFVGKHVVSLRRFFDELRILYSALRSIHADEPCLIMFLSATSTAMIAASFMLKLFRQRRLGVQVGLHGNLAEITGWRTRNPISRRFDLISALKCDRPSRFRFLVLDEGIRSKMRAVLPAAAAKLDVLPLPINVNEVQLEQPVRLTEPIKVGFVGLATESKGIDIFLRAATDLKKQLGQRMNFYHVGQVPACTEHAPFEILAEPVSTTPLQRSEFVRRLAQLHYVVLPYREGYYDLSASGALVDAITWRKPVIVMRRPFVERLFQEYGDIGYLCDDEAQLRATLELVTACDQQRYDRQVEALGRARESRMPFNLAKAYRELVMAGYPELFKADRRHNAAASEVVRFS